MSLGTLRTESGCKLRVMYPHQALHDAIKERWPGLTYRQRRHIIGMFKGWLLWCEAQNDPDARR